MMMPSIFGENLFNNDWMMGFPFERDFFGKQSNNMMKTDVRELENGYEVDIDLPGFKKEDINAKLEDGYLTVSASTSLNKDEQNEESKYIRQERYTGSMSRSFYVGAGIRQEDIKAKYENGILTLAVPKEQPKAVEQNNYIAIEG
ncbi:MAG: Hsp20/alpha crystallin family protein [Clostridia bacterium]|nr:Hsp20/alpha crystallin family protein [Clostridia bacterium]NCD03561.1 Hsp20/alpha crystallin family protein [Clostridia bacterium]